MMNMGIKARVTQRQADAHYIGKNLLSEYYYHMEVISRLEHELSNLPKRIEEHKIRAEECINNYRRIHDDTPEN